MYNKLSKVPEKYNNNKVDLVWSINCSLQSKSGRRRGTLYLVFIKMIDSDLNLPTGSVTVPRFIN